MLLRMKNICLSVGCLFAGFGLFAQKDTVAEKFAATIKAEELKAHLEIFASDEFEGRETGEKGQKLAKDYLVKHYKEYGLQPGNNGSYTQDFHLVSIENEGVSLAIGGKELTPFEDFFYFKGLKDNTFETEELAYVGYGIDDEKYSDYEGIDVEGKVVLMYNGEPAKKGKFIFTNSEVASDWTFDRKKKMEVAKAKGAKAMIVVLENYTQQFGRFKGYLMANRLMSPEKLPQDDFPIFYVSEEKVEALLNQFPKLNKKIAKARSKAKAKSMTFPLNVKMAISEKKRLVNTENVLAFIEGSDLKDEILVISSHFDHIGIVDGQINNGADDDGSGTVSVLELAQAFAEANENGNGPRRSILFMNFTGEEKGLLGSEFYSDNPVFALENTVADLNIDMIGRRDAKHSKDPRYVYIIGSDKLSSDLHNWSEAANSTYTNIELDYEYNDPKDPNRFYYRSDHYNFAKHGIPVIFYFTGVHEDYHKPTDTVEKIEFNKMEEIVQLVFHTAWKIANADSRPVVDKENDFEAK